MQARTFDPTRFARLRSAAVASLIATVTALGCGTTGDSPADGSGTRQDVDPNDPDRRGRPGNGNGRPQLDADFRDYEVNHVLGTGQSLSLGAMGTPPLSEEQPYANLMFDTGLEPSGMPSAFAPLVESATFMDEPVETPASGMANLVTRLAEDDFGLNHSLLVSLHGESGASYPMIAKGTESYERGLANVRAAKTLAEESGKSYVVRAFTVVHGESDGWENWNQEYGRALVAWQSDVEGDVQAITGQSEPVPMFHSQYSAWTPVEAEPYNVIPGQQLDAHLEAPGKVILIGPKYVLPYAEDGFHLTNVGYQWLGEYYAKAYAHHVLRGEAWEPLRPDTVRREGTKIVLSLVVPVPPVILDTERVTDPGDFGFEVVGPSGAPEPIERVEITGPEEITIILTREPATTGVRLRYAYTGTPGEPGGPRTGPRGNLRDSDPTPSRAGHSLYNWCVHFEVPAD
jgi:hypothetical protein